jgi:hypothetical protein
MRNTLFFLFSLPKWHIHAFPIGFTPPKAKPAMSFVQIYSINSLNNSKIGWRAWRQYFIALIFNNDFKIFKRFLFQIFNFFLGERNTGCFQLLYKVIHEALSLFLNFLLIHMYFRINGLPGTGWRRRFQVLPPQYSAGKQGVRRRTKKQIFQTSEAAPKKYSPRFLKSR